MLVLWIILVLATIPLATQVTKHLTTNGFDNANSNVAWATTQLNKVHPPVRPGPTLIQGISLSEAQHLAGQEAIPKSSIYPITPNHSLFLPPTSLSRPTFQHFKGALSNHQASLSDVSETAVARTVTHDVSTTIAKSGILAFPFLAILLLLVFGAVTAATLPFIIAIAGTEVSLAAISVIAQHVQLSVFLTDIVTFLSLGVGIDYSLFISTRFRQSLDQGHDTDSAIVDSMSHAGRSVLYSGIAVALAVAALLLGANPYWRGLALGGAVALFFVLLATHTLLPSIMSLLGEHLHWGRIRRPDFHFWQGISRFSTDHPVWSILIGLAILCPFATLAPQIHMSTPANLATMLPRSNVLRQAVQKQQAIQGAGSIAPIAVVLHLSSQTHSVAYWQTVAQVTDHLKKESDVASVSSPTDLGVSPSVLAMALEKPPTPQTAALRQDLLNFTAAHDPHLAVVYVIAKTGPNQSRTSALVGRINQHVTSWVPAPSRATTGGLVPILHNFNRLTQQRLPWIIGGAGAVALVVLTVATGSVLQAALGVVLDGLVALATAGFLVFINQHQWLGFENQPLDSSITPLIFVLLFGLSMDYEVILLHRIQERLQTARDPKEGVRQAVATTGAMITGAGMIMVVVFLALLISPLQVMKTLGLGLSFAVLADTWIVRSLLVPSVTTLFGWLGFWPRRYSQPPLSSDKV